MTRIGKTISRLPVIDILANKIFNSLRGSFPGSKAYWEKRYAEGGNAGSGSYGRLAEFKAQVLNSFVKENSVKSVIEFGCGDGMQLSLAAYPKYVGLDVSGTAIKLCKDKFSNDATKSFFLYDSSGFTDKDTAFRADLALSLDVIFHLIEDDIFHDYLHQIFKASKKYVVIYSSNYDSGQSYHIKQRQFTKWIDTYQREWRLVKKIDNPYKFDSKDPDNTSYSDFYIYQKYSR
jgi:cyclopropane fatty-acyl-phospholipid synthase-like methyltransferase